MSSVSAANASTSTSSAKAQSPQADNVHVKSVLQTQTQSQISIENTKKINDLLARLGSTHLQVDEYSRQRSEEINEATVESIKQVVAETKSHQKQLLADANLRTNEIENDFKRKLQEQAVKLDHEKAAVLAQLEKELNVRQELILESARQRIDDLNEEANRLKSDVLKESQGQSSDQSKKFNEKVCRPGSNTTTPDTAKAATRDENGVQCSPLTGDKATTQVESSKSPKNSSPADSCRN